MSAGIDKIATRKVHTKTKSFNRLMTYNFCSVEALGLLLLDYSYRYSGVSYECSKEYCKDFDPKSGVASQLGYKILSFEHRKVNNDYMQKQWAIIYHFVIVIYAAPARTSSVAK